jgi:hypothetical protein
MKSQENLAQDSSHKMTRWSSSDNIILFHQGAEQQDSFATFTKSFLIIYRGQ